MEAFCSQVNRPKPRPLSVFNSPYHNVPSARNLRHFGGEYTISNCNRTGQPAFWQDRISPQSCTVSSKPNRSRMCSVILAAASLVVLVTVLAIAGLALYMGALHTETPTSNLITYSCSIRISRGDRFFGMVQEKSRRYKTQFEAMYQRSVLGPALVSCTVDKFGNDTVYFRITFDKRKLTRNPAAVEKAIRDILLTDAISRKPVFRNIRFDPKSVHIKPLSESESTYQRIIANKPKDQRLSKNPVVLKPTTKKNLTLSAQLPVKSITPIDEPNIDEKTLPVIQGSFKISKTEADITEKKAETTTLRTRTTVTSQKKNNIKETSVTSSMYKIAAVEKVSKSTTKVPEFSETTRLSTRSTSVTSTTPETTTFKTSSTTESTTTATTTAIQTSKIPPLYVFNPHMFDEEPWIPIIPNKSTYSPVVTPIIDFSLHHYKKQPYYTSFTHPVLSIYTDNTEKLGSTSIKSHPIPVNKIYPITDITDRYEDIKLTTSQPISEEADKHAFVEIETVQYHPSKKPTSNQKNVVTPSSEKYKENVHQQELRNLSSIFHDLASSVDTSKFIPPLFDMTTKPSRIQEDTRENDTISSESSDKNESISGQGHVEVIEAEEATLLMQTTKIPLVTLIPVKSNSGVGRPLRPLRRRPTTSNESNDTSIEDRSFPNNYQFSINSAIDSVKKGISNMFATEVVTSVSTEVNKVKQNKNKVGNFNIVGVLNFVTEKTEESSDVTRNSKMENQKSQLTNNTEQIIVYATNSSVTKIGSTEKKINNILTPEQIRQLSEISKVFDNLTTDETTGVISTKAISSNYKTNSAGFKILTKTLNKVSEDEKKKYSIEEKADHSTATECSEVSVKCGDGKCLPGTTKCNQLIDCNDGADEQNCTCADYLRSQYLLRKICDGVVDCWDYSDENQCDWCKPNQYVCANSKVCIDKNKICDGLRDCPQGDDERQCVTIAPNLKAADEFPYYSQGYLMVRKYGIWGKLCVENFQNVISRSHISWQISDLGKAVCKSMTYQNLDSIQTMIEKDSDKKYPLYFELAYSFQNKTKSNLSFKESSCEAKKVVKVKCHSLECGARPQAVKHIARIVGGGNAALGAWPWQAALYKEGEFQCGATLLTDRWLISAGHCFYKSQEDHWVARLGALRRGTVLPSPYEQLRSIVRIVIHPGYLDSGFINDISLLQMEFPVVFSDYVRPVCLPSLGESIPDGRVCTVIGWGQLFEVGRIFPDTLQEVQVPVISTGECRKRTVFLPLYKITDDMFCAGYERGGRDACLGDSGGPLMCSETNGRWVLQGITSNGYGCARANRPGVYTKVANYVTWIRSHFENGDNNNNLTHANRPACAGHRCPLGECLPKSRLCNGYIECSDGSDEKDCTR